MDYSSIGYFKRLFWTICRKWNLIWYDLQKKPPNTVWKSFVLSNFHFSGVAFGGLDYFHRSLYRVYMAASNAIEHSKLYASIAVHITFVNVVCLYAYAWMGVWEHLQIWSIYDVRVYVIIPKCWTWMEQSCMVERCVDDDDATAAATQSNACSLCLSISLSAFSFLHSHYSHMHGVNSHCF